MLNLKVLSITRNNLEQDSCKIFCEESRFLKVCVCFIIICLPFLIVSRLTYQLHANDELKFRQFGESIRSSGDDVKLDDEAILSILPHSIISGISSAIPGLLILFCWGTVVQNRKIRENPDRYFNHFCPFCNSSLENHLI